MKSNLMSYNQRIQAMLNLKLLPKALIYCEKYIIMIDASLPKNILLGKNFTKLASVILRLLNKY